MYAIIRTGGKQYTVKPGDVLQVEKLDKGLGSEFNITDVLLIGGDSSHVGTPVVKDASVTVVVTKQARTRKEIVFKKKRRHSYRKFATHKQDFTELFVKAIAAPGGKSAKAEGQAVVKDMAALRTERIETKKADARARAEASVGQGSAAPAPKKAAAKKPAKKAAAKKKSGGAKKKAGAGKSAKKTSKK